MRFRGIRRLRCFSNLSSASPWLCSFSTPFTSSALYTLLCVVSRFVAHTWQLSSKSTWSASTPATVCLFTGVDNRTLRGGLLLLHYRLRPISFFSHYVSSHGWRYTVWFLSAQINAGKQSHNDDEAWVICDKNMLDLCVLEQIHPPYLSF